MDTDTRNQTAHPHTDHPTAEPIEPQAPKQGLRAKIAAGVLAVVLVAGGGFAVVRSLGDDAAGSATTSSSQGPPGGANGAGAPGGAPPVSGTITAVSSTSISVKSSSGTTTTYAVADDVQVQNDGATATVSDLAVGGDVVVFTGAPPGSTTTADSDSVSRIMAGTSATDAAPGGGQAPGAGG